MQRHPGLLLSPPTLVTLRRAPEESSDVEGWEVKQGESRLGDHRFLEPNPSLAD